MKILHSEFPWLQTMSDMTASQADRVLLPVCTQQGNSAGRADFLLCLYKPQHSGIPINRYFRVLG